MALMSGNIGFSTGTVNGLLTGTDHEPVRSSYRPMLKDVLARIEERLKVLGFSATAASKLAGLSEDAIRNMRRAVEKDDRQGVSTSTIMSLAPVLMTTASWLLEGGDDRPPLVPIIGYVGADAEGRVQFADGQDTGDATPIPPGGTIKARGLHVRGHSMKGLADDGAIVYFEDQRFPPTPDLLGYPVVLETDSGDLLVKRLLKGTEPGLYDLESINGPTLPDRRLRWAAEITAIIPPRQARRIVRGVGEDA